MARPRKHKDVLEDRISFRLTRAESLLYKAKVQASGLNQAEFFRECVLGNKTEVIARPPKATADVQRMLFLFNKSSNNLNQLAHRVNADNMAGGVSEETYEAVLHQLEMIALYMKAMIHHAE